MTYNFPLTNDERGTLASCLRIRLVQFLGEAEMFLQYPNPGDAGLMLVHDRECLQTQKLYDCVCKLKDRADYLVSFTQSERGAVLQSLKAGLIARWGEGRYISNMAVDPCMAPIFEGQAEKVKNLYKRVEALPS